MAAGLVIAIAALWLDASPPTDSAADAVTLPDGKVVLGQLLDSDRRGPALMLVRRGWAETNLPERAAAWEKLANPQTRKAVAVRKERLLAWRRDRARGPAGGERITAWIDRELNRLTDPDVAARSSLMVIKIGRAEIKAVARKSRRDQRMLRLGWLSNLPDVEAMNRADLAQALEARGYAADGDPPVSLDALLPVPLETDGAWAIRRAATEVLNDPGGRLICHQGTILPEPAAGEAPPAGTSLGAALGSLKGLLGEAPIDPLPGKLRELSGQGRAGVVVTRLELASDLASSAVETALWVRLGNGWSPAVVRASSVRPDDLPAGAGDGLADDPQVKAAFGLVQSLGLGEIPPESTRRGLLMGAATRMALGQARQSLDRELGSLGLSLEPGREAAVTSKPATGP